ncbi:MAG: hypothetical protein DRP47_01175 [Candidatus Zixiibacteriota bacterium]|nr:MAG: hypothetical protein DRP47_01175 [candidate division Zixibacteria bacterium]
MRKLVLLVCMAVSPLLFALPSTAGVIPSWENPSGHFGYWPISNELSFYQNYDDSGENRGRTFQVVSINSFKAFTSFNFEFTGDFNWRYSYIDPFNLSLGMNNYDYYIELSLVKPVTSFLSFNVQRVIASFENKSINQFGVRLVF